MFKDNFVSQKTGAEVAAEVVKARANGTLLRAGEITGVVDPFVSRKTRAEVNAEVLRARAAGVLLRAGEAQPTAN